MYITSVSFGPIDNLDLGLWIFGPDENVHIDCHCDHLKALMKMILIRYMLGIRKFYF